MKKVRKNRKRTPLAQEELVKLFLKRIEELKEAAEDAAQS
jgi:hypothetical protein